MSTEPDAHERVHELLCLRLYGEISDEEGEAVSAHLQECAACRAFAGELGAGLGSLAAAGAAPDELPASWRTDLAATVSLERRRERRGRLLTFAAGLAAGMALLIGARSGPTSVHPPSEHVAHFDAPPFVPRAAPPPRTTSQGTLARAGAWLRR